MSTCEACAATTCPCGHCLPHHKPKTTTRPCELCPCAGYGNAPPEPLAQFELFDLFGGAS